MPAWVAQVWATMRRLGPRAPSSTSRIRRAPIYAIFCGMNRVRISTTVDARSLGRARQLLPGTDSRLLDRALLALIEDLEEGRELAALTALPYADDPDLCWEGTPGSDRA